MLALQHALMIISFQENLSSDEMPPRWMWALDWEIETHLEVIKAKRDSNYKGRSDDDDDEPENLLFAEMEKKMRG